MGGGNNSAAEEMKNNSGIVSSGGDESSQPLTLPPLISSYNDSMMRPLCDAIHTLRCMNVIEEGITLPTIVVIGDQSSGKSSVIESLTGISLPRGKSSFPLIIRLQHDPDPVSELHLEYEGESIPVNDTPLSEAINHAMDKIVGNGKEVSNVPLTLLVKKNRLPDLTIVDLPGIPLHDQSGKIYKKISNIIEKYIKPEESLILNVMSAAADFLTCESMQMSKKFDKTGLRSVHVFTKADKAWDDMVAIVTTNMGPDYVCVRNQLGDETYEEARTKETNLFRTHHSLSKLHKSIVGIHVLAQKLVLIQLARISDRLWAISEKINEDLNMCVLEQNRSQQFFTTISEAMPGFMQIIKMSQKSLSNIFISREFDEFPDENQMHGFNRLVDMLKEFSNQLKNEQLVNEYEKFLDDEIILLEESKRSEQVFKILFERKIVSISKMADSFVSRVWDYIKVVMVKVLASHAQNYPQLSSSVKKAAKNVIAKTKERWIKGKVLEFLNTKKIESYIHDPQVISSWNMLKKSYCSWKNNNGECDYELDYFYNVYVRVRHLHGYPETTLNEAFDIKTKMVACLEMVLKNVVEFVEHDVRSMVCRMVKNDMETEMVNELKSEGGDRYKPMLKESLLMTTKRWKLKNRIDLLEKLKKVIEKAIDEISFHGY